MHEVLFPLVKRGGGEIVQLLLHINYCIRDVCYGAKEERMKHVESRGGDRSFILTVFGVIFLIICCSYLCSCSSDSGRTINTLKLSSLPPPVPAAPDLPYSQVDLSYPLSAVYNPKLYVYKNDRRLLLVQNDTLIRDYRVALGPHPNGDKYLRGDGRTPEGEFYVCVKNPSSKYYKSLGLSYPSPKHAEEALMAGHIAAEQYISILQAHQSKARPPWNTSLGGAICIHGGGANEDWTLGCVALYNSAIDEIFEVVPVGTPVQILP
jgi:L,D-transpeptidase catalytic domain